MNPYRQAKERVTDYGQVPLMDAKTYVPNPTDLRISKALEARYKGFSEDQLAEALQAELGLNPYSIAYDPQSKPVVIAQKDGRNEYGAGGFQRQTGQISIPAAVTNPMLRRSTIMHELSHAADAVADPGFITDTDHQADVKSYRAGEPPNHFSRIRGDRTLADSLETQAALESGVPPGMLQAQLARMPWLKGVRANQSNLLANPWRHDIIGGNGMSPDSWNSFYGRKP